MKAMAGPSNASAEPNGVHAQSNVARNVQVHGTLKRKTNDTGSLQLDSRPHKRQVVYMDASEEEDDTPSSTKIHGTVNNKFSGSGGQNLRRKLKFYYEEGSAKQLSLQEQRQQLPIAQGTQVSLA
jgi:hypothetical protein